MNITTVLLLLFLSGDGKAHTRSYLDYKQACKAYLRLPRESSVLYLVNFKKMELVGVPRFNCGER